MIEGDLTATALLSEYVGEALLGLVIAFQGWRFNKRQKPIDENTKKTYQTVNGGKFEGLCGQVSEIKTILSTLVGCMPKETQKEFHEKMGKDRMDKE